MDMEDALFKAADALIGIWSERGNLDRYISNEDFDKILNACKDANEERYRKEIMIFM